MHAVADEVIVVDHSGQLNHPAINYRQTHRQTYCRGTV